MKASIDEIVDEEFNKDREQLKGMTRKQYAETLAKRLYDRRRTQIISAQEYLEPGLEFSNALKQLSIRETKSAYQNIALIGLMKTIKQGGIQKEDIKPQIKEFLPLCVNIDETTEKLENLDVNIIEDVFELLISDFLEEEYQLIGEKISRGNPLDNEDLVYFPIGEFNELSLSITMSDIEDMLEFVEITYDYIKNLVELRDRLAAKHKDTPQNMLNAQFLHLFMGPLRYH